MPGVNVSATLAAARGLQSEFKDIFERQDDALDAMITDLFMDKDSDGASETYHIFTDTPRMRAWHRGDERSFQTFDEFDHEIQNFDYELTIPWHANDEDDDQTGGLLERVQEGAARAKDLPIRIAVQLMTSTVDPELLEDASPNAYDGQNLYSSSARDGLANGNIDSGSTTGTVNNILDDWADVLQLYRLIIQPTSGEPYWPEGLIDSWGNFMVICSPANERVFREAFQADLILDSTGVAGVRNLTALENSAPKVKVWSRLSGDDWFTFLRSGTPKKPFVMQERMALQERMWGFDNSDMTRTTKQKALGWDGRWGFGIKSWQTTMQVNN